MAKKILITDEIKDHEYVIGGEFVGKFVEVDKDGHYIFEANGQRYRLKQSDSIDKALTALAMSTDVLIYITPIEDGFEIAIEEEEEAE